MYHVVKSLALYFFFTGAWVQSTALTTNLPPDMAMIVVRGKEPVLHR